MEREWHTREQDLYHNRHQDLGWLMGRRAEGHSLNRETALFYFCQPSNPFYDKECNNERMIMNGVESVDQLISRLRSQPGVEYMLDESLKEYMQGPEFTAPGQEPSPQLFVINKNLRHTMDSAERLASYYILSDGCIYQAPNMLDVMNNRMETCAFKLHQAFDKLRNAVRFAPTIGHTLKIENLVPNSSSSTGGGETKDKNKHEAEVKAVQKDPQIALSLSTPDFTLKRRRQQKHEMQLKTNIKNVQWMLDSLRKKYVYDKAPPSTSADQADGASETDTTTTPKGAAAAVETAGGADDATTAPATAVAGVGGAASPAPGAKRSSGGGGDKRKRRKT